MSGGIDRALAEQLVTALYLTLLGRPPDRAGLRDHCQDLASRGGSIEATIENFLRSEEFASKHASFASRYFGNRATRLMNDVSQYGETEILVRLMLDRAAMHKIVVDVGARGRTGSNSFDLLKHFGWTGLLVEANPDLISHIREEFVGLDVTVVNSAVSDHSGTAAFYVGENLDVSSLTRQFVENWTPCSRSIEVAVRRLGEILRAHAIPRDFEVLSLDVEGEDLKVLNDLLRSTDYRPSWIIVEASYDFRVRSLDELDLCAEARAEYSLQGQTTANLLLGRRENSSAKPLGAS